MRTKSCNSAYGRTVPNNQPLLPAAHVHGRKELRRGSRLPYCRQDGSRIAEPDGRPIVVVLRMLPHTHRRVVLKGRSSTRVVAPAALHTRLKHTRFKFGGTTFVIPSGISIPASHSFPSPTPSRRWASLPVDRVRADRRSRTPSRRSISFLGTVPTAFHFAEGNSWSSCCLGLTNGMRRIRPE